MSVQVHNFALIGGGAISDPTTPTSRTGRSRRINLGVFGHPTIANLIGLIGLLIATTSALIAYFDWQGNVAERAGKATPTNSAPASPTLATAAPELSYQLTATPVDSHTVKVTAKASGRPRPLRRFPPAHICPPPYRGGTGGGARVSVVIEAYACP